MTAALPSVGQLRPNPHWARLPLFDRKGWMTKRMNDVVVVGEVIRERARSFLTHDHLEGIVKAYERFKDESDFTRVATLEEIRAKDGNLSIPLYVAPAAANGETGVNSAEAGKPDLTVAINGWLNGSAAVRRSLTGLFGEERMKEIRN